MPLNSLYAQLRQLQIRLSHLAPGRADYNALLNQIQVLQVTIHQAEQGGRNWSLGL